MDRRTDTYAFFVYQGKRRLKTKIAESGVFIGCKKNVMETNNNNFNSEGYQKENEGFFQKVIRFIREHITVTILTLIVTGIGVYIQCTTTDAGKVIERLYQEALLNAKETKQLITNVDLPDSIENTTQVLNMRECQNKIHAFNLLYLSIVKAPCFYKFRDIPEEHTNLYYKNDIEYWTKSLICLSNIHTEILNETESILDDISTNDTIAFNAYNRFTIKETKHYQQEYDVILKKTLDDLKEEDDINKK